MDAIYRKLEALLSEGTPVAVATIVRVRGSVPREVGTKMIVHPYGLHVGTVGGGCGEADVIRAGLDVIQTGTPATVRVDLTEELSMQSLGVCGGIMDVFVEAWKPAEGLRDEQEHVTLPPSHTLLEKLFRSLQAKEPVALVTAISANGHWASCMGQRLLAWLDKSAYGDLDFAEHQPEVERDVSAVLESNQHRTLKYAWPEGQVELFVQVQRRPPHLVIVGAGHVAAPLAHLGKLADFQVTVLDDRPQYANRERFPSADRVLAAPLGATLHELGLDKDSYVVLVTRGHQQDVQCLLEIWHMPLGYIGMIGSKRRVRAVLQLLSEEQGIAREKLGRVYAPIGLPIGAETPAEIAIAIMAEIINVYRGGHAKTLSESNRGQ